MSLFNICIGSFLKYELCYFEFIDTVLLLFEKVFKFIFILRILKILLFLNLIKLIYLYLVL